VVEVAARSSSAGRSSRLLRWVAASIAVAAGVALGWWAARATLVEQADGGVVAPRRVVATVTEATVGRSVAYNATVTQAFTPVASNALAGTVTHVGEAEVDVGDELYSVDGDAVRVVEGDTPFWRDMSIGVVGPDVLQLEEALVALGYFAGTADDTYTAATYRAVWAWQKATGHALTGAVAHGEVVAVASLPTTVRLDESVRTGLVLVGGEPVVLARQDAAQFALVLMQDQAAQVPPGAQVSVAFAESTWPAVVAGTTVADDGSYHLVLESPAGGPVCGKDCALLPAQEVVSLMADVALVPSATGPGVPAAAIRTDEAGETYATRSDGTRAAVVVTASGDGVAIVDGLEVGDTVVVLDGSGSAADGRTDPVADDDE